MSTPKIPVGALPGSESPITLPALPTPLLIDEESLLLLRRFRPESQPLLQG